jgi:hypothetical protein
MAKATLDYNSLTEENLTDKFWAKVNKTQTCWLWTGKIDDGYGRAYLTHTKQLYLVHRALFAIFKEPIRKGLVVDHLCKVRACCNPKHLRQVTISENTKGHATTAFKEICPNGHFLIGDDAEVYFSMRKDRAGREVMHLICSICNYPQVAQDVAVLA